MNLSEHESTPEMRTSGDAQRDDRLGNDDQGGSLPAPWDNYPAVSVEEAIAKVFKAFPDSYMEADDQLVEEDWCCLYCGEPYPTRPVTTSEWSIWHELHGCSPAARRRYRAKRRSGSRWSVR